MATTSEDRINDELIDMYVDYLTSSAIGIDNGKVHPEDVQNFDDFADTHRDEAINILSSNNF